MRVGVIGRGFGARVVAPVFAETDGCTVVDVVSPRDDAAVRALCARADVDLVAVHSPPFLHADHVELAVGSGRAVLCDKPFGTGAEDAERMLYLADAAGVVHLLNFEFRCHPARQALRSLVRDGAVGIPEHVQWTQCSAGSRRPLRRFGWLFDRSLGGGWIGAWGSHALDFLRWTLGEPEVVASAPRTTITERPDGDGVLRRCTAEDAFVASLRWAGGATVTIDTTFVAPVDLPGRISVLGAEGALEAVADLRITQRGAEGTREVFALDAATGDPHRLPMRRWAEIVRDTVHTGEVGPDTPTFVDGLACARLMDALRT